MGRKKEIYGENLSRRIFLFNVCNWTISFVLSLIVCCIPAFIFVSVDPLTHFAQYSSISSGKWFSICLAIFVYIYVSLQISVVSVKLNHHLPDLALATEEGLAYSGNLWGWYFRWGNLLIVCILVFLVTFILRISGFIVLLLVLFIFWVVANYVWGQGVYLTNPVCFIRYRETRDSTISELLSFKVLNNCLRLERGAIQEARLGTLQWIVKDFKLVPGAFVVVTILERLLSAEMVIEKSRFTQDIF